MVTPIKRIESLEKAIRYKQPRFITILIEAEPEDRTAHDVALQQIMDELKPQPDDLVVEIRRWTRAEDEILPRLAGIVPSL